ncbi:MAG: ABC transporter permease [Coriobacteriia bacterium]|nr:ABC transporter permease [Coriobacteriia bacterium]
MSMTIVRAALEQRRTSLLWYSFGLAAYSFFIVWYYPQFAGNEEFLETIQEAFSPELMAAFGAGGLDFSTLGGFLGVEYLSLIWVGIVGAAVIGFAAKALASDIEAGTMEVTLTQPVSRRAVAVSRYVAMVIYAVIINLATVVPIKVAGIAFDVEVGLDSMALLFAMGMLVSLAIGGVAFAVSAYSNGGGRVAAAAGGLLALMWLLDFISNVNEGTEFLGKLTLFHYWEPARIIDDVTTMPEAWWVFGIATVVFPALAVWHFMRRDVAG